MSATSRRTPKPVLTVAERHRMHGSFCDCVYDPESVYGGFCCSGDKQRDVCPCRTTPRELWGTG